jgi:gluconolactonase
MSVDYPPSAGWRDFPRYPDPAVEVLDPRFAPIRIFSAAVERLYTGCRWAEGPVWFGDGRYLLWSDIPNQRILKWEEETGQTSIYRKPSNWANGNTRDRQGRLVTCEHGRRLTRTEYDGSITVLADSYQGKRLNSPNDVVVKADGSIWFTDPYFGIMGRYEGDKAESELAWAVYRLDPESGEMTVIADDIDGPNGLCFSPDESILYVVASRSEPTRTIVAYDMSSDGKSVQKATLRVHIDAGPGGTPDGMRCDTDGNLWGGRSGWCRGLCARRRAYWLYQPAGAVRQCLLRRAGAQPAVHGGEPVGLCGVCECAGC